MCHLKFSEQRGNSPSVGGPQTLANGPPGPITPGHLNKGQFAAFAGRWRKQCALSSHPLSSCNSQNTGGIKAWIISPSRAKDGKRINEINKATLAGEIETQMGNGGRAGGLGARGRWQPLLPARTVLGSLSPAPPPAPTLAMLGARACVGRRSAGPWCWPGTAARLAPAWWCKGV